MDLITVVKVVKNEPYQISQRNVRIIMYVVPVML